MRTILSVIVLLFALSANAGLADTDKSKVQEVVFSVKEISCNKCKEKITKNLRFEKGLKSLKVNVEEKTVTIKFDSEKTSIEDLKEALKKLGYTATEVKKEAAQK